MAKKISELTQFPGTINGTEILPIVSGAVTYKTDINKILNDKEVSSLADGSVTVNKIADGNVTNPKLADESVTQTKLATNSVINLKIADGAVTENKLAANSVTEAKIADSSVTNSKIADGSITGAKIAPGSITNLEIGDLNVTEQDLASFSVTTEKIADATITTSKYLDGSVTNEKLADGSVTGIKIAPGTITIESIEGFSVGEAELENQSVSTDKIVNNSVTNAKLSQMPARSIKVNPLDVSAQPSDLSLIAKKLLGTNSSGEIVGLGQGYKAYLNGNVINFHNGVPVKFNTTTNDANPTAGSFKFNSAVKNSITKLWINNADASGLSYEQELNTAAPNDLIHYRSVTNTNSIFGTIKVTSATVDKTGYKEIGISFVSGVLPGDGEVVDFIHLPLSVIAGNQTVQADSSYVYIAYAEDAAGTGFTEVTSDTLPYIAILATTTAIPVRNAGHFAGRWYYRAGSPGNTILYGTTDPTNADGINGNFYYQTTTKTFYGPKAAGVWPSGVPLQGADGDKGGFKFTLDSSTVEGNPGVGKVRLNSTIYDSSNLTELYISATTVRSQNLSQLFDILDVEDQLFWQSNSSLGDEMLNLGVTSITPMDSKSWYKIGISYRAGGPLTALDDFSIVFQDVFGLQEMRLHNVAFLNTLNQLLNKDGVVISGVPSGTYAQMSALNKADYTREYFHVTDYGYKSAGIRYFCTGTDWVVNDHGVLHDLFTPRICICPATQATAIANNGGKVQVAAAGHLLTAARAVDATYPRSIRVNSWSGSGASAGIYNVLSVDSANAYTIDLAYNASYGVPSVGLKNTELLLPTVINCPPLNDYSQISLEITPFYTSDAGDRSIRTYFNNVLVNNAMKTLPTFFFGIRNTGSKTSQETVLYEPFGGVSVAAESDLITLSQDTSQPSAITFRVIADTYNVPVGIKRVRATVRM